MEEERKALDVNHDGQITSIEAMLIQKKYLGLIFEFPDHSTP